jgi:hypothetical protein
MNVDLSTEEAQEIVDAMDARWGRFDWERVGEPDPDKLIPDACRSARRKAQAVLQVRSERERTIGQPTADELSATERRGRQETIADPPAGGRALVAHLIEAENTATVIGLALSTGVRKAFWRDTVLAEDPDAQEQVTDWERTLLECAVFALAHRVDRR